jgi:hypothetical protein
MPTTHHDCVDSRLVFTSSSEQRDPLDHCNTHGRCAHAHYDPRLEPAEGRPASERGLHSNQPKQEQTWNGQPAGSVNVNRRS